MIESQRQQNRCYTAYIKRQHIVLAAVMAATCVVTWWMKRNNEK